MQSKVRIRIHQTGVILLCIVINLIGGMIATRLSAPVWLDSIGTFIVAIVIGPVTGACTGAVCSLIRGLFGIFSAWYMLISIAIGLTIGHVYPREREKKDAFHILTAAALTGLVAVAATSPVNIVLKDGYTGNAWGDALFDMLSQNIDVPILNTVLSEFFVEMPDKVFSLLIAALSVEGTRRLFSKIHLKRDDQEDDESIETKPKKKKHEREVWLPVLFFTLITATSVSLLYSKTSYATGITSEYEAILYGVEAGLETSEINAIAQTPDGYLWAGSYSGLYRYEGTKFVRVYPDEKINTVMQLFVDSRGKLWIGTNESGIACYDTKTREIKFYTSHDGLGADSIRSICEDERGNVYVGTTVDLAVIDRRGKITTIHDSRVTGYVRSMVMGTDGIIGAVSNDGMVFFVKDKKVKAVFLAANEEGLYYTAIGRGQTDREYMIGTGQNRIDCV